MSELRSKLEELEDHLHGLGDDVNHERGCRHTLEQTVQNHYVERLEDRSKSAFSMLGYERNYHALRDELSTARRGFEDLRPAMRICRFNMRTWFATTRTF